MDAGTDAAATTAPDQRRRNENRPEDFFDWAVGGTLPLTPKTRSDRRVILSATSDRGAPSTTGLPSFTALR